MTIPGDLRAQSQAWEARQRADVLARLDRGEEIPLADALFYATDDDCSRAPSSLLLNLAGKVLGGGLVASALADPFAAERAPVNRGVWYSARLAPGDFYLSSVDVMNGQRLHDVHIRLAEQPASTAPSLKAVPHLSPPSRTGAPLHHVEDGPDAAEQPRRPDALSAAAAWIAAQNITFTPRDYGAALAPFGLRLGEDGQSIAGASGGTLGEDHPLGRGRRPSLAALLVQARISELHDFSAGGAGVAARARELLRWVAGHHPSLEPPAQGTIERMLRRNASGLPKESCG